ncbi:hypothetical protein Ahy_B10g105569 [Arachis hypogaea]|uniref:EF-hand domain-containing protein n=1 Tax=Arachis hypogaea TaxID=3818 RepID=A0A444X899_ARAHY|nr:hypothetical protein Ahy_B10g105569 [Arachis hypogaea]
MKKSYSFRSLLAVPSTFSCGSSVCVSSVFPCASFVCVFSWQFRLRFVCVSLWQFRLHFLVAVLSAFRLCFLIAVPSAFLSGNTLKLWNREFLARLHSSFKKAPEAVFLAQIATNSNPRAQSEVKKFAHYDYNKKGTISAKDFALSLVAVANINHINKLLDMVEEMNDDSHLRNIKITFQEFEAFAELRKQLEFFSLSIFSYGKINGELTKSYFQRVASQVCGITITDAVADIIFHVFYANRDGNLSADEFIKVMQRRESSAAREGMGSLLSCFWNCATKHSSTKLQS